MLFISIEDFYKHSASCRVLNRQEEIQYAKKMRDGDFYAREKLIESYLPMVANHMKRMNPRMQHLGLALYCVQALEKALDSFDFLQDSEPFSHRLSWWLRKATTRYIVR